jgi:zinc/manganese transport system substrate-binding protein
MKPLTIVVVAVALAVASLRGLAAGPINIVAAENFYGDVAQQIGGPEVKVMSILNNPNEDPHLFEASPSVARELSAARIIIYNGIDYDPWVDKLLGAAPNREREVIVVAQLVGRKPGDNPHIWYDPKTMPVLAEALAEGLSRADPAHRTEYQQRLSRFRQSLVPIDAEIAALRKRLAGSPVTATEPVFDYMLAALGMQVRDMRFQLSVMNNTEPSPSEIAGFENDLRSHRVRLLIYNSQASDPVAQRMLEIAKASNIPVVGATETEPPGKNYQDWTASELDAIDRGIPK